MIGRTTRLPAVLAISVFLLGFSVTWVNGPYSDTSCFDAYAALPEGSGFRPEPALWPPGGECVYELPDGSETTRSNHVPVVEWAFFALLGCLVGAGSRAVLLIARRVGRRSR